MSEFLTISELSERWKCTEQSIRKKMRDKELKYRTLPGAGIRFKLSYIIDLEGGEEDITKFEYKKLAKENIKLKEENKELKNIITTILIEASKIIKS